MKKIFGVVITLFFLSSIPLVVGQLSIGEPAFQKSVNITLGDQGEVHVIHEIRKSKQVVQIEVIEGTLSNLKILDKDGNDVDFATTGLESVTGITIFPSNEDVLVEYDLDEVLFFKDGIWYWDFFYSQSTTFIFPKGVDLGFVNENPFLLFDAKGITCHGCDAYIEYTINESTDIEKIQWENYNFDLGIRTLTEIQSLSLNQSSKSINFYVNEENKYVTLIIPLELLWNPYQVFLDEKKIPYHEFFSNETHSWLNFKPNATGTIHVIGTTVIPEFPMLAPLFLGIAIVIVIQLRGKINLH